MPLRPTDFYLNLDRWDSLAAVERERGRWEARRDSPRTRLDAIQREATIEAAWSLASPGDPLDRRTREAIAQAAPLDTAETSLARARVLHRALVFIHGWYPAFNWSSTAFAQICRLLGEAEGPGLEHAVTQLLRLHQVAQVVREQTVGSGLLEAAAYQGGIANLMVEDAPRRNLYLLGLRVVLLQAGYVQVLFAPIESVWLESHGENPRRLPPPWTGTEEMEERLGSWLDEVVEDLLEVGRRAEEKWERHRRIAARSALQESILTLASQNGRVTAGEILRTTGANRNTVKDNLSRLVANGLLARRGSKRGTVYLPV
jgi:hypothetical protein